MTEPARPPDDQDLEGWLRELFTGPGASPESDGTYRVNPRGNEYAMGRIAGALANFAGEMEKAWADINADETFTWIVEHKAGALTLVGSKYQITVGPRTEQLPDVRIETPDGGDPHR